MSLLSTEVWAPSSVEILTLPYDHKHNQNCDTMLIRFNNGEGVIKIECGHYAPDDEPGENAAVIAQALADGFAAAAARFAEVLAAEEQAAAEEEAEEWRAAEAERGTAMMRDAENFDAY